MPTFGADQVDPLKFDFTPWGVEAQGVIPEPSSDQMETFIAMLREIMPVAETQDGKVSIDIAALAKFFEGKEDQAEDMVNEALSAVCSNTPTADEIKALPYRVKQMFYGFVVGNLFSPES